MTILQAVGQGVFLFVAALLAGALNSVAGGGSFITTPALLSVGLLVKNANTTNTAALWPGNVASAGAYRDRFGTVQRNLLILLIATSLIGGTLGALTLLNTPNELLSNLFPFLFLMAISLFTFGNSISSRLRARLKRDENGNVSTQLTWPVLAGISVVQFFISLYGGYFGGGIGIMMLAALSATGMEDMHAMNALKTLLASCINGAAIVIFILSGTIYWPQAIVMIAGATIGGYGGAHYARRIDPRVIRYFVIIVGYALTIYFFLRPPK